MLQNQADAEFMRHVLAHSASAAQRAKAEEKLAKHEQEAARLAAQVGDPDEVPDRPGDLPPDRRTWHLSSLMTFRHDLLRGLDERRQRQRFRTVLAMPALDAADMCSECEALADWHTWDISLCLYRGKPEPGSQAEAIARLVPVVGALPSEHDIPASPHVGSRCAARLRRRAVDSDAPLAAARMARR